MRGRERSHLGFDRDGIELPESTGPDCGLDTDGLLDQQHLRWARRILGRTPLVRAAHRCALLSREAGRHLHGDGIDDRHEALDEFPRGRGGHVRVDGSGGHGVVGCSGDLTAQGAAGDLEVLPGDSCFVPSCERGVVAERDEDCQCCTERSDGRERNRDRLRSPDDDSPRRSSRPGKGPQHWSTRVGQDACRTEVALDNHRELPCFKNGGQ